MADQKLSALTELATTPADNDEVYIRDVSEAAPAESKRITVANLMAAIPTQTLNPANETVTEGWYAGTTLSAVDVDLAAGNIADGVTIFGFLGTFTGGALAEDVLGSTVTTIGNTDTSLGSRGAEAISAGAQIDLASITPTFDASSIAVGVGSASGMCSTGATNLKMRLYLGGVQVAESDYFTGNFAITQIIIATRALSGSQICKITMYNYDSVSRDYEFFSNQSGKPATAAVAVGSIKL